MKLESLMENIESPWRRDFVTFVQTGDASAEFLNYLDRNKHAQAAVEQAFTTQAEALEGLAKLVKSSNMGSAAKSSPAEGAAIARSFERIAELPHDQIAEAVTVAAEALAHHAAARPDRKDTLKSALSALQTKVGTLVK